MNADRPLFALPLLLVMAACQTNQKPAAVASVEVVEEKRPEWQTVATPADQVRLQGLNNAWNQALADARRGGFAKALETEGELLQGDASLPRAAPPPGSYRCRIIKMGAATPRRGRGFEAFKPFFCFIGVDGTERLSITKQTGSQRPGGYLWDTDTTKRLIFLGSVALGNEEMPLGYGEDPKRDMAGVFERYDDFRYRLVVPWPQDGAKLHVFEFIPVSD